MGGEELLAYYARRAYEYERIYEKPERQKDLARVRQWLRKALTGKRILEVACGTGYWTGEVAPVAAHIVATDASPEVLTLAREKRYPPDRVHFDLADAYALEQVGGSFTAGFAAFWWSHVPRERQLEFLAGLHRRIGAGALVVLLDNRYVAGSSTPIARRDTAGNTYQRRRLVDGTVRGAEELPDGCRPRGSAHARGSGSERHRVRLLLGDVLPGSFRYLTTACSVVGGAAKSWKAEYENFHESAC